MSVQATTATNATDPLLRPLGAAQQHLLAVVGDAVTTTGGWPVYQYVQAKLDEQGLDIEEVLATLPYFAHAQLHYSLVRRDRHGVREEEPVRLSVAGMAHLDAFAGTATMFLRVLNALAERRAAAPFEPGRVVAVQVSGPQLVAELGLQHHPGVGLLPELLGNEPATWHGSQQGGDDWTYQPSSHLRRFREVADVDDYLTRMRAWLLPPAPAPVLEAVSPLGVVAAFDYLDVVWQLKFDRKLVHVPSGERLVRLTLPVAGADEFDSRLSALGEMFKGLDVPGTNGGPFDRLRRFLRRALPAVSVPAILGAVDTLQHVTHVRNAGQHVGAAPQAATALRALGLPYPVTDHAGAWDVVQRQVINALDTIRAEANTLPSRPLLQTQNAAAGTVTRGGPHRPAPAQRRRRGAQAGQARANDQG
ncbi:MULTISPECIES: hypothetical protein [Asanoa]|uniref:Uncharacterized protein n=2 Tax=Asanoa TaxID=195964 RepID=A0A239PGI0_9ACTN|nr:MULTISPECIES: hypothetical protein [Asanoa]GIF75680.1 hypothetical protein Asi02nite_51980 [Asanoa siamensis]SNT66287.1 hypothetical protein SAMN05421812_13634 [Asanoa hainanensis]